MAKTNKTGIAEAKEEESWKFRIVDITPFFKEVKNGIFKKIREDDNLYTCTEEYHGVVEGYISNGLLKLDIPEEDPLRVPLKRYAVEDGRFMCYESKLQGNGIWKEYGRPITDNFYIVIDEDVEFDDGIEKIHKWRGRIIVHREDGSKEYPFDVDGRLFANQQDMSKLLLGIASTQVSFDNNKYQDIRNAAIGTSDIILRGVSQVFGWHSSKVYQTQSSMIVRGGVRKMEGGNVDLSGIDIAKNLDIKAITDKEFRDVGKSILKDLMYSHERYPIDCLLGFTFLAPIASQIISSKKWSGSKIGMWIVGGSGCGKTHTSLLFQNFFGDFYGENATFSWLGTPFSIQAAGYHFKDAIFMVDDFKIAHFSGNALDQVVMVLQNYTDRTSRSRFTNQSLSSGDTIRGSLLITGEDVLDDVGSIMGRFHIVEMNSDYMNEDAIAAAYDKREFYSGFMGRYISWLMGDPKYVDKIVTRIEKWKRDFMGGKRSANIHRVAQSFAYNLVGFEMFCRFLEKNGFISMEKQIEMVKIHKNNLFSKIDAHVLDVKEATVSEIFLNILADLINSGEVGIEQVDVDSKFVPFQKFVGFDVGDQFIYFYPVVTWNVVGKSAGSGKGLMNSKSNLTGELIKRGLMLPGKNQSADVKKIHGHNVRVWKILKEAVGYSGIDDVDVSGVVVTEDDMEDW